MQGIRAFDRKRLIIFIIIPIILLAALIGLDQITKYMVFDFLGEDNTKHPAIIIIENFFSISCTTNKGAGFSLFADKEWGQLLFKIITPIALIAFIAFYVFAVKNSYKWLSYSIVLVVGGTIGNYIDRLLNGKVIDFLRFNFFPTFNVADICLTVGVIMLIVHFLFFDKNAVFKKKPKTEDGESSTGDKGDIIKDENL